MTPDLNPGASTPTRNPTNPRYKGGNRQH
jgi:hypothetical protein